MAKRLFSKRVHTFKVQILYEDRIYGLSRYSGKAWAKAVHSLAGLGKCEYTLAYFTKSVKTPQISSGFWRIFQTVEVIGLSKFF